MFNHSALADPSFIEPFSKEGTLQVVIETPKGSRNKYAFDHDRHVLVLKKVMPAGMVFPYDFGFVPSTLAPDGDPIDVLLLMDEPAFPGCVVEARVVGVIEGEDVLEDSSRKRNDRLLAVALHSHTFAEVQDLADLPKGLVEHMREFFVQYPALLAGKTYDVLGVKDKAEATRLMEEARR